MALSEQILQTFSIQTALGTIAKETFVDADGAQCAASEMPFGINDRAVDAGDEQLINTFGLFRLTAGAAIVPDEQIEVGASGKALTFNKWADKTGATSGLLVVGKRYRIGTFQASDDFTNVGAVSNVSGEEFEATGTTPTTWTNSSVLFEMGKACGYAVTAASGDGITFLARIPN